MALTLPLSLILAGHHQHVHKKHHEFKSPTALAAVYAHPLEVLFANVLPLWVGPCVVMDSHLATWYLWIVVAVIGTQYNHAGYRLLPLWLDHNPDFHDRHHVEFEGNYGLLYVSDWAFSSRCEDMRVARPAATKGIIGTGGSEWVQGSRLD